MVVDKTRCIGDQVGCDEAVGWRVLERRPRDQLHTMFGGLILSLLLILVTACAGEQVVEREVVVTQLVEVTREVPIQVVQELEVTREVPVEVIREVEVTREVPVEVTRLVVIEATAVQEQVTEQVTTNASSETTGEATVVTISEQTENPSALATTIVVAGEESAQLSSCWTWQEASQHIGQNGCIEAVVTGIGESANAFFINFSPERDSFYAVAFDWAWEELTGECLHLSGTISEYQGRAQLIINDPTSQVYYCGSDQDGPPAFER